MRAEAGASENQSGETRRLYILTGSLLGLFPLLSRVCMRFDRFSGRRQGSRSRGVVAAVMLSLHMQIPVRVGTPDWTQAA